MTWLTIETEDGEIHVVPCDGTGETPSRDHHQRGCWCRPQLIREGPLDDPVINHIEPSHPGASTPLS